MVCTTSVFTFYNSPIVYMGTVVVPAAFIASQDLCSACKSFSETMLHCHTPNKILNSTELFKNEFLIVKKNEFNIYKKHNFAPKNTFSVVILPFVPEFQSFMNTS